jgi:hypothetical protein
LSNVHATKPIESRIEIVIRFVKSFSIWVLLFVEFLQGIFSLRVCGLVVIDNRIRHRKDDELAKHRVDVIHESGDGEGDDRREPRLGDGGKKKNQTRNGLLKRELEQAVLNEISSESRKAQLVG